MGPTRAELVEEVELWKGRCDRNSAERNQVHVEVKALKKRLREVEGALRSFMVAGLNEPDRVEGCSKVRFHREAEAHDWAESIARGNGEAVDVYRVYPCKLCPRSPVTIKSYFHVGHAGSRAGQTAKKNGKARRTEQIAAAGRNGNLIRQRVDPEVLAKLRKMAEED